VLLRSRVLRALCAAEVVILAIEGCLGEREVVVEVLKTCNNVKGRNRSSNKIAGGYLRVARARCLCGAEAGVPARGGGAGCGRAVTIPPLERRPQSSEPVRCYSKISIILQVQVPT
jgi:hypothetical protein